MEVLLMARVLWRRRLLLGVGLLAAVAVAFALGSSPPSTSAVAWTRVVLDTPKSQLVDAEPVAANSLPWRAGLLAHLLATPGTQEQIARAAGLRPEDLKVIDPTTVRPPVLAAVPQKASEAASSATPPYTLVATVADDALPLLALTATAPDRAAARRLASAATRLLERQSAQAGAYKSMILTGGGENRLEAFEVKPYSPVRTDVIKSGGGPVKAIGAAFSVWVLWCAGVLALPLLGRILRGRPVFT
jgi:hypothetical protein